jgi:hypothetical protein
MAHGSSVTPQGFPTHRCGFRKILGDYTGAIRFAADWCASCGDDERIFNMAVGSDVPGLSKQRFGARSLTERRSQPL